MSQTPYIGQPVRRVEDARFLTGGACYTDDIKLADQTHSVVVRSPHAHARIIKLDVEAARQMPGVLLVLTHEDLRDATLPIPSVVGFDPASVAGRNGRIPPAPPHWPLTGDKARLVGDGIAFVVAETLADAQAGAEAVVVEYESLTAIIDFDTALEQTDTLVWEQHGSNVSFEWEAGDATAVESIFEEAAHVARVDLLNPRQIVAFMEPRAMVASYAATTEAFTIRGGCQSAHSLRDVLAYTLQIDARQIRVIVPDTGGGFGARNVLYPEFILTALAARLLGRPVKWTAERTESFLTDTQARDQRLVAELALDDAGQFLAVRARLLWRHGAYLPPRSLWVHISFMPPMLCGVYRIPKSYCELIGLFSNTAPVHAFRGVGRAEMAYLLERLVDEAARISGYDRIALRRQNLIAPEDMPYRTAAGALYGYCEFEKNLDQALELVAWKRFSERRESSSRAGKLRGIGVSVYVESTGGAPTEFSEVRISADGFAEARMGTQSFGMGHETVFAQVLADQLGIDMSEVRVIDGDTDMVRQGAGSHGSRSIRIGGGALVKGSEAMLQNAMPLAANFLEVATPDIAYRDGAFIIPGTDRSVGLFELATFVQAETGESLRGDAVFETTNNAYANGCHISEVEIDPETGVVTLVNHVLVTDVGRVINPLITDGQLHGGITQGIGQAITERVSYDSADGQLHSASFMDYCLPRADDLPNFSTAYNEVHCDDNPLGAKGAGEGPTTGCPPAVMNAIMHALETCNVTALDMPATPQRVWSAVHAQRTSKTTQTIHDG